MADQPRMRRIKTIFAEAHFQFSYLIPNLVIWNTCSPSRDIKVTSFFFEAMLFKIFSTGLISPFARSLRCGCDSPKSIEGVAVDVIVDTLSHLYSLAKILKGLERWALLEALLKFYQSSSTWKAIKVSKCFVDVSSFQKRMSAHGK